MNRSESLPGAPPQLVRRSGEAPEEWEAALREVLACFEEAEGKGALPSRITVAWENAAVGLRAEDYRDFKAGRVELADLGGRTEILSGADPKVEASATISLAPAQNPIPKSGPEASPGAGSSALPGPVWAWVGGLGCGFLVLVTILLVLVFRKGPRPRPRRGHAAPPPLPPPLPPAPAPGWNPPPTPPGSQAPSVAVAPPPLPVRDAHPPALPPPLPAGFPTGLRFEDGPLAGRRIPLAPLLRVGREPQGNDLVVEDPSVSRRHAELRLEGGILTVRDLGSANGTRLNGLRLDGPGNLNPGDLLVFGNVRVRVE
ncbi:MAG: FHA domain-containing protein [Acidobacteria bacterium]|nr:FHA domain-containing protein [Acidobacteriota bacterium]